MTTYEQTARAEKAQKMAGILIAVGIPERNARLMTPEEWRKVARAAGCNPPRSEETRQAVYSVMAASAAPARMTVREWRERMESQCQAQ